MGLELKNKLEFIGIFLRCAIMVLLGLAFNPERDRRYLPFMVIIAFVMLMFFLMKIIQFNLKKHQKQFNFSLFHWGCSATRFMRNTDNENEKKQWNPKK